MVFEWWARAYATFDGLVVIFLEIVALACNCQFDERIITVPLFPNHHTSTVVSKITDGPLMVIQIFKS